MHTQIGFDKTTKTYASAEVAQKQVEKTLSGLIEQGVVFNILIVEDKGRFVPLLNCWRVPAGLNTVNCMLTAARAGFMAFA
jgi:hypothetical protein